MISVQNLRKQYGSVTAVEVDKFYIKKGECVGLVGNNGAGKTTLFQMLLDLVRPTAGSVHIDDMEVQGSDEWKRNVGSFLDDSFLISYLTPDEYFTFVADLHGYGGADLDNFLTRFRPLFNDEIIGKKKYISSLSRGNMKKVGIAAAFIGQPSLVMLDEPFENLDPTSQTRLKEFIAEDQKTRNTTFLISSHDLYHVADICTRVVLMEKGKIIMDMNDDQQILPKLEAYFDRQQ
jgi:ABC-2 type transport system ATP-binding protein